MTVLFADIVGFTALSAAVTPEELVELLNEVFSRFDELAERHGLEKIKTIGDAYMVAAGLPEPRADHAEARRAMALEMQAALERISVGAERPLRRAHRHPHRAGGRRRDRQREVHLRPLGRHGEHREPHGVARRCRAGSR